jgi:hypothetical protein
MPLTASTLLVLVLPFVIYLALSVPTLIRLFKGARPDDLSSEWLESFSPSIYLPMERLLNSDDFAFLSGQPGFDLSLYRKFRKDRLRIFRQYLERMIVDFNRLHLAARLAVSQTPGDHSALLPQLILLKIRFSAAVLLAEFRYHLCLFGLKSLSVRTLILQFEELSAQFQAIRQGA